MAAGAVGTWWATALAWLVGDSDQFNEQSKLYSDTFMSPEISVGVFNLTEVAPALAPLYPFKLENEFGSGGLWSYSARQHMVFPFVCCAVYVVVVFGLKKWMEGREAFRVRQMWIWWNALLSVFSWCGALRMVPHLAVLVSHVGFTGSFCSASAHAYGWGGASGLWTGLFIYSKVPELLDTVFIVLMKADLHFLQWYHHITVLLYSWHSYATRSGAGVWFVTMNYSVHAVMYLYFALMLHSSEKKSQAFQLEDKKAQESALKAVRRFRGRLGAFAPLITVMQISQMAVGVTIMVLIIAVSNQFNGDNVCEVRRSSVVYGLGMYFSYLCLFVHFGIRKYCCGSSKKEKKN